MFFICKLMFLSSMLFWRTERQTNQPTNLLPYLLSYGLNLCQWQRRPEVQRRLRSCCCRQRGHCGTSPRCWLSCGWIWEAWYDPAGLVCCRMICSETSISVCTTPPPIQRVDRWRHLATRSSTIQLPVSNWQNFLSRVNSAKRGNRWSWLTARRGRRPPPLVCSSRVDLGSNSG